MNSSNTNSNPPLEPARVGGAAAAPSLTDPSVAAAATFTLDVERFMRDIELETAA